MMLLGRGEGCSSERKEESLQKDIWVLWLRGVRSSRNLGVLPSNSLGGREGEKRKREGGAWAWLLLLEPREQSVPAASLATKI